MLDIFVDMHQYKKIDEAGAKAQSASDRVDSVNDQIRILEAMIGEQRLIIQSLCELLIDNNTLIKQKLFEKMNEVDIRDGIADGKIGTSHASVCEKCFRRYNFKVNKCQYCGNINSTPLTTTDEYKASIKIN